jgi:hypothetical protein
MRNLAPHRRVRAISLLEAARLEGGALIHAKRSRIGDVLSAWRRSGKR